MSDPKERVRNRQLMWYEGVDFLLPYLVHIATPNGSGTGFLLAHARDRQVVGIATADHVIAEASKWRQPIRIWHPASGRAVFLEENSRVIKRDETNDVAAILLERGDIPFPDEPLETAPEGAHLRIGGELGWLGFPAVAPDHEPCFFHGHISCWLDDSDSYLVDGVAINGVSGGPAFCSPFDSVHLVGVVSAYIPNRSTGIALPGVAVVCSVNHLRDAISEIRSLDEAQATAEKEASKVPPTLETEGRLPIDPSKRSADLTARAATKPKK